MQLFRNGGLKRPKNTISTNFGERGIVALNLRSSQFSACYKIFLDMPQQLTVENFELLRQMPKIWKN